MSCCGRKFIITEEDKKHILSMYGLVSEEETPSQSEDSKVLDLKNTFGSGLWNTVTPQFDAELKKGVEDLGVWLTSKEGKGQFVVVQIEASESKVPNYDNEQGLKVPLQELALSRMRAKTMKSKLEEYFQVLVDNKTIKEIPVFEAPVIKAGGPAWDGKNANDKKYTDHQYVKVYLKVISPAKCLSSLEIIVAYYKTPNDSFPCRGGHTCDRARFNVLLDNTVIGEANLNNASDGGDRVSAPLKVSQEVAAQILKNYPTKKTIMIGLKAIGENPHSGAPEILIQRKDEKGTEILYNACSPAMREGDTGIQELLEIDPCGNVLKKGSGTGANSESAAKPTTTATEVQYTLMVNTAEDIQLWMFKYVGGGETGLQELVPRVSTTYGFKGKWKVNPKGIRSDLTTVDPNTNFLKSDTSGKVQLGVLNVDPGTIIKELILNVTAKSKLLNTNPPPGNEKTNPVILLTEENQKTTSGKYHVELVPDTGQYTTDPSKQKFNAILVAGDSKESAQASTKAAADKIAAEKARGVIDLKLSGGDTIADFENYYVTNKLVEKIASGEDKDSYKVISPNNKNGYALSYGGKTYKNGNILRFS